MYTPEEIKDEHDMPTAIVEQLGEPESIDGVQVLAYIASEGKEEYLITACESDGGISTISSTRAEVIEVGQGDYFEGLLELMQRHAADPLLGSSFGSSVGERQIGDNPEGF